jgi:hypothetical protein
MAAFLFWASRSVCKNMPVPCLPAGRESSSGHRKKAVSNGCFFVLGRSKRSQEHAGSLPAGRQGIQFWAPKKSSQ